MSFIALDVFIRSYGSADTSNAKTYDLSLICITSRKSTHFRKANFGWIPKPELDGAPKANIIVPTGYFCPI